jgi:hypothetical protein
LQGGLVLQYPSRIFSPGSVIKSFVAVDAKTLNVDFACLSSFKHIFDGGFAVHILLPIEPEG